MLLYAVASHLPLQPEDVGVATADAAQHATASPLELLHLLLLYETSSNTTVITGHCCSIATTESACQKKKESYKKMLRD